MKRASPLLLLSASLFLFLMIHSAYKPWEEGMFPLSETHKLDLKKAGLKIDVNDIYNPRSVSLIDALVNVGGCTGSFVSANGLIITNHHCAFSAVQLASTPENDYLNKGFVAANSENELEAKGLTCRITESYTDVSDRILAGLSQITDPASRLKMINNAMTNIALEAEKKDPTIKAEVSEMFMGKTYVLFRYKTIQDVRLVYVPNRQIGEFGGETDNWVWPRHTGDFSFMRAYVAPDGSSAKYAKENIPYKPKKFLRVNPKGTNEEDFVFMLGYPGKTYRHRPAEFIAYQQKFVLPYVADLYNFQNTAMENVGKESKSLELKLATRIKRNANTIKNYRGKIEGLKGIELIAQKKKEDANLVQFINGNQALKIRYGNLMTDIDNLYKIINSDAQRDLWLSQIYNSTSLLRIAKSINNFKSSLDAQSVTQKQTFFDDNISKLKQELENIYESYDLEVDKAIFKKMLEDASAFNLTQKVDAAGKITGRGSDVQTVVDRYVETTLGISKLNNQAYLFSNVLSSPKSVENYNDGVMIFEKEIAKQIADLKPEQDRREGLLNKLMGDYVTVKEKFLQRNFIPDANKTLRLTYGYVRGYKPADGMYMRPYTSIKGILEKGATEISDFKYPEQIKTLWDAKEFGPYVKKNLNDVPVCFLYNMDTTQGNSGSPVLNAMGELIGVNFDRAYTATINDYAWNESYSRSIGVDIRYILWVASKIDKADFLIKEMGIKL